MTKHLSEEDIEIDVTVRVLRKGAYLSRNTISKDTQIIVSRRYADYLRDSFSAITRLLLYDALEAWDVENPPEEGE